MSSQRGQLILKLARIKAKVVEKKENGAQDNNWKISQHNINTSSTDETVNSVTVNKGLFFYC